MQTALFNRAPRYVPTEARILSIIATVDFVRVLKELEQVLDTAFNLDAPKVIHLIVPTLNHIKSARRLFRNGKKHAVNDEWTFDATTFTCKTPCMLALGLPPYRNEGLLLLKYDKWKLCGAME